MRNEIHQDQIKTEEAKVEAEKEAKEVEEQKESAGIELDKGERTNLYTEIKKVTAITLTWDEKKDEILKKG